MRFTKLFVPTVLLCCLITVPVAAQGLGYYPVEELGLLESGNLEVDVNLEGSTLQIAVGAMQDQDPRLKDLVSNLTRVRVQVGSAEGVAPEQIADRIAGAVAQLESRGWVRIISVEDGDEMIYVYSIDGSDGNIAGLTALVSDGGDEVVVANLAGSIDPVLLGSVMSRVGDLDFDDLMVMDSDDD